MGIMFHRGWTDVTALARGARGSASVNCGEVRRPDAPMTSVEGRLDTARADRNTRASELRAVTMKALPPRSDVLLCTALVLSGCGSAPWRGASEIQSRARCGMTVTELEALASPYRRAEVVLHPDRDDLLVVSRGRLRLALKLDQREGLKRSYYWWTYGFMRVRRSLTTDHCTGQHFVEVSVQAPDSMAGADVLVDGSVVGRLSSVATTIITVETGRRTIGVRAGERLHERTVVFPQGGHGYDYVHLQ